MKRISLFLTLAVVMTCFVSNVFAAGTPVTTSVGASCYIAAPLLISPGAKLNFGSIIVQGGGWLDITSAGVVSSTGIWQQNSSPTLGTFTLQGETGYAITFNTTIIDFTYPGLSLALVYNDAPATLSAGVNTVHIGGHLTVASTTAAGPVPDATVNATAYYN